MHAGSVHVEFKESSLIALFANFSEMAWNFIINVCVFIQCFRFHAKENLINFNSGEVRVFSMTA